MLINISSTINRHVATLTLQLLQRDQLRPTVFHTTIFKMSRLSRSLVLGIFLYFLLLFVEGSHHIRRKTTTSQPSNDGGVAVESPIASGPDDVSVLEWTPTTTAAPPLTTRRRIVFRTTTKSRSRGHRRPTTKPSKKSKNKMVTTTTTTTTTTTERPHRPVGPIIMDPEHQRWWECRRHPELCRHDDKGGHHPHSANELPRSLRYISWANYIEDSTLKLPMGSRAAGGVSAEKSHKLGFGSPDIMFQPCNLPGDRYTLAGRCRFLQHCARPEIIISLEAFLNYSCIIGDTKSKESDILGVCCPPDEYFTGNKPTGKPTSGPIKTPVTTSRTVPITTRKPPLVPGCGEVPVSMTRIVGGQKAGRGKWPWMAALLRSRTDHYCGGALISDRHILTASHCVDNFKPNQVTVRLGEHDFGEQTSATRREFQVSDIFMHERYDPVTYLNDVAILKLKERVGNWTESIKPICLHSEHSNLEGKNATVAGWGLRSENDQDGSQILMEVVVPVIRLDECKRSYSDLHLPIVEQQLCAGYPEGGKDSCSGDSGGPLMYQTSPTRPWHAIGIVSWGVGCAQKGRPGVYARTSAYFGWIQSKMAL